jgi:hypothetical protein
MLDNFQSDILKVLATNRTPQSVMAGGSVLNYHAFRLSDDQDLFHADGHALNAEVERDVGTLREHGFQVDVVQKSEGLFEAVVSASDQAPTVLQWVQSGLMNFFAAVPDPDFGYRLHFADLAVNKVDAAASRKEVRDFVDLYLIHTNVMPLWHAIWAAPGKNEQFSPTSIVEELRRKNSFSQARIDEEIESLVDIDAGEMGRTITTALNEAEEIALTLPAHLAGNLFLDHDDQLVNDPAAVVLGLSDGSVKAVGPVPNGAIPSSPSIDRALVDRLVEEYGYKGSKLYDL